MMRFSGMNISFRRPVGAMFVTEHAYPSGRRVHVLLTTLSTHVPVELIHPALRSTATPADRVDQKSCFRPAGGKLQLDHGYGPLPLAKRPRMKGPKRNMKLLSSTFHSQGRKLRLRSVWHLRGRIPRSLAKTATGLRAFWTTAVWSNWKTEAFGLLPPVTESPRRYGYQFLTS
jgi:hypothetical protein